MTKLSDVWLCVRFPYLSLNSLGVIANNYPATMAVTSQNRIWQHNGHPKTSLICEGMTVSHAQLLIPELDIQERQPLLEQEKLKSLAHWAYQFTSLVSLHESAVLLEVGKSISLFKKIEHILNLINHDLISFRMTACLGISHTPQAALLVSFNKVASTDASGDQFLSALNLAAIEHLNISQKTIDKLTHCGFVTLGDINSIPHAQLGRRFGVDFLNYLDKLFGRVADLQQPTIPPETFAANVDFAEPISNVTWITQQLERLLVDLCCFIRARQLVCQSFVWHFFDEKSQLLQSIKISLSQQARTNAVHSHSSADQALALSMLELTQLKIATLKFTWSISRIELISTQLVAKQLFDNDLFNSKPDQNIFNELIDKLISRLGQASVYQLSCDDAQLPEHKNSLHLLSEISTDQRKSVKHISIDSKLKDQPIWLLPEPQLISQRRSLHQPEYQGPLQIIHGPDRIVSHWWSNLQSRDYYIARQRNGRLLWLFFNRKQRAWFLHGLFA